MIKKEFENLQDLLRAEATLKKQGILKVFMRTNRLQNTVESTRLVMDFNNPLLIYIEKQLSQIRQWRITGLILLLVIAMLILYPNGNFPRLFSPAITNTLPAISTPTNTIEVTPTIMEVQATTVVPTTNTPEMETNTPPSTSTETLTPTPTETTLGIGYINKAVASVWKEPNAGLLGTLILNKVPLAIRAETFDLYIYTYCPSGSNVCGFGTYPKYWAYLHDAVQELNLEWQVNGISFRPAFITAPGSVSSSWSCADSDPNGHEVSSPSQSSGPSSHEVQSLVSIGVSLPQLFSKRLHPKVWHRQK